MVTIEEELPEDFPLLGMDPEKPWILSAFGKKGSGKSELNRLVYGSYVGDKLCIDVNGNADPGPDAVRLTGDLPKKWPEPPAGLTERRPRHQNLHYRAHPMSPTYRDDLDRALGLALFPQDHRVLVWAGEVGELMPNGKPGPHMRALLQQNRHYKVTCLFDGPRPVYVDPLVISQSNLVAVFRLPNPADRKRIADEVGCSPKKFDEICHDTWRRGDHWFVLCDPAADTIWKCAPLPLERTHDVDQLAGASA